VVLHGSVNGVYQKWTIMANGGQGLPPPAPIIDNSNHMMTGRISPTVVPWPNRGSLDHSNIGTSCGVFINTFFEARFYCYDKAMDRWNDHSTAMYQAPITLPKTATKVGLAYHVTRQGHGGALGGDKANGQFWMAIAPPSDSNGDGVPELIPAPSAVQLYISRNLSSTRLPSNTNLRWRFKGPYWDAGKTTDTGTNLALYEDESISALKGAWFLNNQNIIFLPFADGTFSELPLTDGKDFQVMERGLCAGTIGAGVGGSTCGSQNKFGY
jgi:hypothetical protein